MSSFTIHIHVCNVQSPTERWIVYDYITVIEGIQWHSFNRRHV